MILRSESARSEATNAGYSLSANLNASFNNESIINDAANNLQAVSNNTSVHQQLDSDSEHMERNLALLTAQYEKNQVSFKLNIVHRFSPKWASEFSKAGGYKAFF